MRLKRSGSNVPCLAIDCVGHWKWRFKSGSCSFNSGKNEIRFKQLNSLVRDTYKWLLAPLQEPGAELEWEVVQIASNAPKLALEIENRLYERRMAD